MYRNTKQNCLFYNNALARFISVHIIISHICERAKLSFGSTVSA